MEQPNNYKDFAKFKLGLPKLLPTVLTDVFVDFITILHSLHSTIDSFS